LSKDHPKPEAKLADAAWRFRAIVELSFVARGILLRMPPASVTCEKCKLTRRLHRHITLLLPASGRHR